MTLPLSFRSMTRSTLFAVLFLALVVGSLQSAGAQPKAGDFNSNRPETAGTVEVQMCEGLGGTATVGEHRTVASGLTSTTVSCNGGMMDGITCTNTQDAPVACDYAHPAGKKTIKRPTAAVVAQKADKAAPMAP
jgi:hypothetical protein